ncbi:uncharacterized protein TRIADDRAFT_58697 [Trichoplax adhaerens]|uniref:Uncharacterized protein n=1 Tax=Trichoplax adhaerens TaxID=10228 RepID=B3S3F3_TRIAD|nr:predicted protein [Trichoplax adhaerens]EDV22782.1 predicted protein [Trichoplax adhaerens]|eukprot:XP_002114648.1 predicted protein [Trichoplax adhaerens]
MSCLFAAITSSLQLGTIVESPRYPTDKAMASQQYYSALTQDHQINIPPTNIRTKSAEDKIVGDGNIASPTKRRRYRKSMSNPLFTSSSIPKSPYLPAMSGKKHISLPELNEQTNLTTNRIAWKNSDMFKSSNNINAVATPTYNRKEYLKKRVTFATHLETDNNEDSQHQNTQQKAFRSRKISDPIRPILKNDNRRLRRLSSLEDCSSPSMHKIQTFEPKITPFNSSDSLDLTYQSLKGKHNDQYGIPTTTKLAQAQANAIKLRKIIRSMSNESNAAFSGQVKPAKKTLPGRNVALSISNGLRKLKNEAHLYLIK